MKRYTMQTLQEQPGMSMSDKSDFKTKTFARDGREGAMHQTSETSKITTLDGLKLKLPN